MIRNIKENKFILGIWFVFVFVILLSSVSSAPPQQISDTTLILESAFPSTHKLGEDYYVHTHVYDKKDEKLVTTGISCYYHFYNHQINGGEHVSIGNLTQYGMGWFNYVNGSVINQTGEYSTLIWCNSSTQVGFNKYTFDVTSTGYELEQKDLFSRVFLIIFVVFLCFVLSIYQKDQDLEKWNRSLIKKYQDRNFVKFVLGSIWYNLMKNSYAIYYVLGLFLMNLLYELISVFNIETMFNTMEIIISLYTWGLILVGIVFFSHFQEWIKMVWDQMEDLKWGVHK